MFLENSNPYNVSVVNVTTHNITIRWDRPIPEDTHTIAIFAYASPSQPGKAHATYFLANVSTEASSCISFLAYLPFIKVIFTQLFNSLK